MENNIFKNVSIVFAIVSAFTGPALLYGIIWFEKFGSDIKRTLLNRLVSSGNGVLKGRTKGGQLLDITRVAFLSEQNIFLLFNRHQLSARCHLANLK